MSEFFKGIKEFFVAIGFIFKHNLWWVYFIPIVLTIVFFWLGWFAVDYLIDYADKYVESYVGSDFWGAEYLKSLLLGLVWVLVRISFFVVFSYLNGYLILMLISPFLAYVSEKTEKIIAGKEYPFSLRKYVNEVVRGILINIRNAFYQLFLYLILLILLLVPIAGVIVGVLLPVIMFFISSYFYGFSFIDYFNERRGLNIKDSVMFVRLHKGFAFAVGGIFALTLMLPFIGSLLAGMVAFPSTVAATKVFLEDERKEI